MRYSGFVCLFVLTAVNIALQANAQSPALQQGVSVQMAVTSSAAPMPDADKDNARIVAVTEGGSVYLGIDPITLTALTEKVRSTPFFPGQKLYIKADARTPYAKVLQVLSATQTGTMAPQILLTAQREAPEPGTILPPRGLEVMVDSALPSGSVATVVQLVNSGQQRPLLTINGDEISWSALESTLRRHFQKGDGKVVLLKADGGLPFVEVVHVIDACHSTGAKVFLDTPEL